MYPWTSITAWQRRLMLFTVDSLSAEGWHSTLLEGLSSGGHWGSGVQGHDPLHDDSAHTIGFQWDSESAGHSIWGTPASSSWCDLDELGHYRPWIWNQACVEHNDWINVFSGSTGLSQYHSQGVGQFCPESNTIQQWLMHSILFDISNSIADPHFCSMGIDFHQRTALRPTGSSSSANAPWPKQDDDACAWWCGQIPLQIVLHADHADVSCFECSDVTPGCISPPLNMPGAEVHSSSDSTGHCSQRSGHQHWMCAKDVHLNAFLWLFQSLCLCCNLLMTLCDTLSSVATSLWEHPV